MNRLEGWKGEGYFPEASSSALTQTAKSLGALEMLPVGDSVFGMCSRVNVVGQILMDNRTTRYPWEPLNAQQFPGQMSGQGKKIVLLRLGQVQSLIRTKVISQTTMSKPEASVCPCHLLFLDPEKQRGWQSRCPIVYPVCGTSCQCNQSSMKAKGIAEWSGQYRGLSIPCCLPGTNEKMKIISSQFLNLKKNTKPKYIHCLYSGKWEKQKPQCQPVKPQSPGEYFRSACSYDYQGHIL